MSDDPVKRALALVAEAYWEINKITTWNNPILPEKEPDNKPKLTKREARDIREMHRLGTTQRELAEMYDVNPATISRTVRGVYHR